MRCPALLRGAPTQGTGAATVGSRLPLRDVLLRGGVLGREAYAGGAGRGMVGRLTATRG